MITRRGDIIGSVRAFDSSDADQLIAAGRVARFVGVEALDVERLQALVDDVGELDREIVARLQVVAFEQVKRAGLAALICFEFRDVDMRDLSADGRRLLKTPRESR